MLTTIPSSTKQLGFWSAVLATAFSINYYVQLAWVDSFMSVATLFSIAVIFRRTPATAA